VNCTVLVTEIDAALSSLDVALAGWPESTPGAAPEESRPAVPCRADEQCTHIEPCPVHGEEPVHLTGPERGAETGDRARAELERLVEHVRQLAHHARAAATITHRWAHGAIDQPTVRDLLGAIDAGIWCSHCVRFGEHEPREEGRKLCAFCRRFQLDWGDLPSLEIWEARNARGGRLDVGTIERLRRDAKKSKGGKKQPSAEPLPRADVIDAARKARHARLGSG
jgi:hypothetical protein